MSGAAAVEVRDLRRTFAKDVVAVNDVSFTVLAGESVGLVGESVSGKTTIARLVYGLDRPTSGTVAVCGNDRSAPPSNKDERRRRARELQMVFQNPYTSFDPRQPVAECLAKVVQFHQPGVDRSQRSQRVAQLIDLVGLTGSQSKSVPRTLSAASASGLRSQGPWPQIQRCVCWTNRYRHSTSRCRRRFSTCWRMCGKKPGSPTS